MEKKAVFLLLFLPTFSSPLTCKRYIDDIFSPCNIISEEINKFIDLSNNNPRTKKFDSRLKLQIQKLSWIHVYEGEIFTNESILDTCAYFKPTDQRNFPMRVNFLKENKPLLRETYKDSPRLSYKGRSLTNVFVRVKTVNHFVSSLLHLRHITRLF